MKKVYLLVALATTATMTACIDRQPAPKQQILSVKTATAVPCYSSNSITLSAKIRPAEEVNVAFKVSGTLKEIPVKEGQKVHEGDVIAVMDDRDYAIQFSATEAEYKQIKGEAERVMNLYRKNSVSRSDYDKAVYGLQQITAKYDAHRNALADTRLRAPVDGYVDRIVYSRGETVGAGYPVVKLVGSATPEMEIFIPASEFVKSDRFTGYDARIDLFPDKVFKMKLSDLSRKANLNGLYSARLSFADPTDAAQVTVGMVATVDILYDDNAAAEVSIPMSAVVGRDGEATVWVLSPDDNTVAMRKIKVSRVLSSGTAVVEQGLAAGETVVTAGTRSLTEGKKVKPLAPRSATNRGGLL